MICWANRQEQTTPPTAATPPGARTPGGVVALTLHFCDEDLRIDLCLAGWRAHSVRVSLPGPDIRTPHVSPGRFIPAPSPLAFTGPGGPIDFAPA